MSVELLGRDQLPADETSAAALPILPASTEAIDAAP
jgi:hypothetical protein